MLLDLKLCQTRDDLAYLLGYTPSSLSYVLYKIPDDLKYTTFPIKKKDGSDRIISAPIPKLKRLQKVLSDLLYACIAEILDSNPRHYSSLSAYAKGMSIADNAKRHASKRFVFNVDLQDFFGSIHIGRVRGFFAKDKQFLLNDPVALTIAQIACHQGSLPQGSPCSPVISNLIGSLLDARLARFGNRHGCAYSRYADDLTFSTNKREFPAAVATPIGTDEGWAAADELVSRITGAGYVLNPNKTRMSVRASRQVVTGLVVNSKVNVSNEFHKRTRAMCHRLFSGLEPIESKFFLKDEDNTPASISYVEGRLSHIYFVRNKFDYRSRKEKQDDKSSFDKLYRDFLLYKIFFRSGKPLIITEGESDRIYLKLAARHIYPDDPLFTLVEDGRRRPAFLTLNYSKRLADVVGLSGGTGNIIKTMVQLRDFIRTYRKIAPTSPVTILVDNDQGSASLLKQARTLYGAQPSPDNTENFNKLSDGLYLVRTPSLPGQAETYIEAFLPPAILSKPIDGKTFSPDSTFDTSDHIGKVRMAQIVALNASAPDLVGYKGLLDRLRSVWLDWAA